MKVKLLYAIIVALLIALFFRYDITIDVRISGDRYIVVLQPSRTGLFDVSAAHEGTAAQVPSNIVVQGGSRAALQRQLAQK